MFNIPIETIATIASVILLSITQIILVIKGNTDEAQRLEIKKQKQITKLTTKRDKCLKNAVKNENKIKEISGKDEKSNTSV